MLTARRCAFARRSFDRPAKLNLLDLKLPKVEGTEVLKQIKNDSRGRHYLFPGRTRPGP